MAVITIFNGSYCHADTITAQIKDRLGYECIDDELMAKTSERFNIPREKLERALTGSRSLFDKYTHEGDKNIACLKTVLAELILQDGLILNGSAGHLIPRTISHVLKVCIIANHDYRVAQLMQQDGKSEKEAKRIIHNDDKLNSSWTMALLDKLAYDEDMYDIVIPMHKTTIDEAVEQIVKYAQVEAVQPTERSRRVAQDFLLSSRINLALVEAGHLIDVNSENGEVVLLINEYVVRMKRHQEVLEEIASGISGVKSVTTRLGPKYQAPSINPWANIEGPPKILLVDDEKEFVNTLSQRLETRDLQSSIAYDGEQALEMLKEDVPDVMVLDLMMPGINGIEVLREVKKQHANVQVIILTGHGSDHERATAEKLGAFAYLEKPINIDNLAKVMREAYKKANESKSIADNGMDDE